MTDRPKKIRVLMIERHPSDGVSIERVFENVRNNLDHSRFEVITQKMPHGSNPIGVLLNLLKFTPQKADVYHVTGHVNYISLLLPANRSLVTFHDLISIKRYKGLRNLIIKTLYLDLPFKWISRVTAISTATRNEILSYIGLKKEIKVITNPLLTTTNTNSHTLFNSSKPVILHIGTAPNKNLDKLVDALEGLTCKLRVIGPLTQEVINKIRSRDIELEHVASLDDEGIIKEYLNCDIVSFCSVYEGFGLPIIEAQSFGKPVITSDLLPMSDVAGDGALLIDPYDHLSIRNAIETMINENNVRASIIENGYKNIKRFDPITVAQLYGSIYEEIALTNYEEFL